MNTQTDEEIIARHDPSVRYRAKIELAIVHKVINKLMNEGYECSLYDEDSQDEITGTEQELVSEIFSVDEAELVTLHQKTACGSFVRFVMGNDGHDVICDYGTSLEPIMKPIFEWIDSEIEKVNF